jgi:hypothetical protein
MEELQEKLRGTEDLHGSSSLRMSSDSLDFPASKPTRTYSNNCFEPKHFLATVSLTRLDCEPVNTPDFFSTLSCPDLMFEIERSPQPFHLRLPSLDYISDSQETLKAEDDDDTEIKISELQQDSFYLNLEQNAEDNLHVEEVTLSAINKLKSFEDCSSSSSTTYVTCSETSLFSATASRPTSFVQSNDSLQLEGNNSSNSSLAYFTPMENTPVSSKCTSPVPPKIMQRKALKLSMARSRRQNEQKNRSSSTPSSPVPAVTGDAEQACHTLPRVAKKHRSPSPQSKLYGKNRDQAFSVDAAAFFPLEPRTLHLSSIPSQLHTADSLEELQEFLLLESQCVVERTQKTESD